MSKPKNKRVKKQQDANLKIELESQRRSARTQKQSLLKWQIVGFFVLFVMSLSAWAYDAQTRAAQQAKATINLSSTAGQAVEPEKISGTEQEIDDRFAALERQAEADRIAFAPPSIQTANLNSSNGRAAKFPHLHSIASISNVQLQNVTANTVGSTPNPFLFNGQYQDETGLYYLRNRYYDPTNGRFLTHDPVMGSSDDPETLHRYLYAGNDPVNNVDPSGREFSLTGVLTSTSISTAIRAESSSVYGDILQSVAAEFNPNYTSLNLAESMIESWGVDTSGINLDDVSDPFTFGKGGVVEASSFGDFPFPIIIDQNNNHMERDLKRIYGDKVIVKRTTESINDEVIKAEGRSINAVIITNNFKDFKKDYPMSIGVGQKGGSITKKDTVLQAIEGLEQVRREPDIFKRLGPLNMKALNKGWFRGNRLNPITRFARRKR